MDKKTYDDIIDKMAELAKCEYTIKDGVKLTNHLPYATLKPMMDKMYTAGSKNNAGFNSEVWVAKSLLQLLESHANL